MNKLFDEISGLDTEKINPNTTSIDVLPVEDCLRLINQEDQKVALKVKEKIPEITKATNLVIETFKNGGRLIYIGAGTSGRLGVLDAAECPPTFGSDPAMVQGIMAGGEKAMFVAQEGAEDSKELAESDLKDINLSDKDTLCGLAASGRTPYVVGGIGYANSIGVKTILISTSKSKFAKLPNVFIAPETGPEVIMGSTRMKSGTAQKLILNMITTTAFVKLGKTYNNIMIDLQMTNQKLKERAKKTIIQITGVSYKRAEKVLEEAGYHVKPAILMTLLNISKSEAEVKIKKADGIIKNAISG